MNTQTQPADSEDESDEETRRYPFGLPSRLSFLVVVTIGLIGPGFGVYILEGADLSLAADIVWIIGYGTTIFVVWYVWIRPLELLGSSAQDWSELEDVDADTERSPDGDSSNVENRESMS
ncbi:hypothetical protein DEQ92_19185 [Haloferax sp. Atlit-6N]|jgi:hypothetical protein|uniref:hypothetical protein n=1 Tax=Haloferax sp. Atlit-6N TaxID=2077205 RepID=UPI000E22FD4D|nr:hypothetical protein [Haloferax sp. Atlit-6N]REA00923.1 hypothetical protein DEQ92_19185 [Haloferax sp. Atlit-6N]